jgi:hypothetical protein
MRKPKIRRPPSLTVATTARRTEESLDLETAEPDLVRTSVSEALSHLADGERQLVTDNLLTLLNNAGVRIGQCLLLLGIPARTADELTAPEIGALIRYVRINEPKAMAIISPVLSEIVALHTELMHGTKAASKAA